MKPARFATVILAAGKGTRMKSDLPKVMHPVANRPMVAHVLAAVAPLEPVRTVVVLAPGMDEVARLVEPARVAIQEPPLGTGHAVMSAMPALADLVTDEAIDAVLVVYGDTPLLTTATLRALLDEHGREPGCAATVLGMRPPEPGAYGRLILGEDGHLEAIVEAKDATEMERRIGLCNSGVMAIDARHLASLLEGLGTRNAQGEYYLTDVIRIARGRGLPCRTIEGPAEELTGVNSRAELAEAEAAMQCRLRRAALEAGASLIAPDTVWLSADTRIGRDAKIHPYVVLGPGVTIGEGAEILSFCHFTGATIAARAIVGPYARLRPGAEIGEDAHIGNFVEVKNARIGAGAKANHLSYVGDSEVGAKANIGAGTITCNYDGFFKSRTAIGAGAFIGSNTALVAPVTVGEGAMTGAGSIITRDVPPNALVYRTAPLVEKTGEAASFRERRRAEKERAEKEKAGKG